MKICIYGGTFDPPHIGHIHACRSFFSEFDVDVMYIIPTYIPPHKTRDSSVGADMRFKMAEIAFSDISDKIVISDVELKRKGKSYTSDTIEYFLSNGADTIYLLCGTDMFVTLDEWHDFENIFKNSVIVCARRENDSEIGKLIDKKSIEYREKYGADIRFLNENPIEISSSDIRNIKDDKKLLSVVTENVYKYIKENNLYEIGE